MTTDDLLPVVRRVAEAFHERGRQLYLVGGIVRDQLLDVGGGWSDIDLTTDARPEETKAIVAPLASAVWTQGERFGTIGCRIDGQPYEITTFRGEAYDPSSRKPAVVFADALEVDLSRRDFTINAMALDARTGALHDPFDGRADLAARRLRTPSGADISFSDDPLRMLRAARFLSRFALEPATDLDDAIRRQRHRLEIVSVERVRDELHKLLLVGDPTRGLRYLVAHGLLDRWLPELAALAAVHHPQHGDRDALTHTLDVVRATAAEPIVRLAALVHDLALATGADAHDVRGAVDAHDVRGAKLAHERLDAMRHARHEVRAVAALVAMHHRLDSPEGPWTPAAVRAVLADAAGLLDELVALSRANAGARASTLAAGRTAAIDAFVAAYEALGEVATDLEPELDGAEVMEALGIAPGREVGEALAHLRAVRMRDGRLGPTAARDELRRWWATRVRPEGAT